MKTYEEYIYSLWPPNEKDTINRKIGYELYLLEVNPYSRHWDLINTELYFGYT